MKSKAAPYLIIIILALAVFFLKKWKGVEDIADAKKEVRKRGFDRRVSKLEYTQHALCRMECRKISKSDVQDIMRAGEVNYAKTNVHHQPCPIYALQGYTDDGQYLRVIFAQCESKTKVVTCYDLEREFECFCPGDDKKLKKTQAKEQSRK